MSQRSIDTGNVTVVVPTVAVLEAVNVKMLLGPVADAGLNAAVTPAGWPLALSATAPVNPQCE